MIRLAIRCTIFAGILAALVLALLYLPEEGSSLSTWDREGHHAFILTLWGLVGVAVALVVGSIVLHRLTDLLDALGLPYSHQLHIEEAEARGEAPN